MAGKLFGSSAGLYLQIDSRFHLRKGPRPQERQMKRSFRNRPRFEYALSTRMIGSGTVGVYILAVFEKPKPFWCVILAQSVPHCMPAQLWLW